MTAETKEICGSVSLQETGQTGKIGIHPSQRDFLSTLNPRIGSGEIEGNLVFLQASQTLDTDT
jgi:hypothetical protein